MVRGSPVNSAVTASTMVSTGSKVSSGIQPPDRSAGVPMAARGDTTFAEIPWP